MRARALSARKYIIVGRDFPRVATCLAAVAARLHLRKWTAAINSTVRGGTRGENENERGDLRRAVRRSKFDATPPHISSAPRQRPSRINKTPSRAPPRNFATGIAAGIESFAEISFPLGRRG